MFNSGKVQQNLDREKNPSGFFDFRKIEQNEIRGGEEKRQHLFDSYTETTLHLDTGRCINCKRCTQVCPHAVFAEGTDHVELARPASCMECGACTLNCPVQAITVQSGVGCAWAMISAALRGKDMDSGECSCGGTESTCCGQSQEPSCGCEDK
jgi:NAD-dependent dihydropyrimidine dehydrogenase PreA subunit